MATTLIFDTETDDLFEKVSKLHVLVIKDHNTGDVTRYNRANALKGLERLASADVIVGHNALGFDIPVLEKLYGFKFKGKLYDTMLASRLAWADVKDADFNRHATGTLPAKMIGSHSLEAWGYRMGILKGEFKKNNTFAEWSMEMEEYCVQDVEVTHALYRALLAKNLSEESVKLEHDFAGVIWLMSQRGFSFNSSKAGSLYAKLQQKRVELEQQLRVLFPSRIIAMKTHLWETPDGREWETKIAAMGQGGFKMKQIVKGKLKTREIPFNPSSRDEIAERLIEKYGWKPTVLTDNGKPKVDESVLEGMAYPEARLFEEYLMLQKRLGQIADGNEGWLKAVNINTNRIHGRVITNGAVTGRCSHLKPNMAQVPNHSSPYGKDCRELFEAGAGMELVGFDASGLELRCLAHFMARYDNGAYTKEILEGDVHTANQKAAGLPTRNDAKTFIYAFLYGAGDEKIGKIIGKGQAEGKRIKEEFLRKTPALRMLREAVTEASTKRGYLVGLDGRILPIRSAHAALNTLLQSAGAMLMKMATVFFAEKLRQNNINGWLVAHVHDEVQSEVIKGSGDFVGKLGVEAIKDAGRHFKFRCPLDGEYRVGNNWSETH